MTTLSFSNLAASVLRLMDENGGHASFMSGDDATAEIKEVIRQVTGPAVRNMHLKAPIAMLEGVSGTPTLTHLGPVGGRYPSSITLASEMNFFRMLKCRMASWNRPVTQLWWEDSVEYAKQRNKYLMGTKDRPMAFLVHDGGVQKIELYSSDTNTDTLAEFVYMQKPEWSDSSASATIGMSDRLVDSCLMQIAADTLMVLGETDRAQMMAAKALEPLNTFGGIERHYSDIGNRVER